MCVEIKNAEISYFIYNNITNNTNNIYKKVKKNNNNKKGSSICLLGLTGKHKQCNHALNVLGPHPCGIKEGIGLMAELSCR